MDATFTLKINPQEAVPSDPAARVAWLERFGVLPDTASVPVTLSIAQWLAHGVVVGADGLICQKDGRFIHPWGSFTADERSKALNRAAHRLIAETGLVPDALPRVYAIAALQEVMAKEASDAAEKAARQAAERADAEAKEAAKKEREDVVRADYAARGPVALLAPNAKGTWGHYGQGVAYLPADLVDVAKAELARRNDEEPRRMLAALREIAKTKGVTDGRISDEAIKEAGRPLGFVDEGEALSIIADAAFDGFAPYVKLTENDVAHEEQCNRYDEAKFMAYTPTVLSAEDYADVERLRARLPAGAVSSPREHQATADCTSEAVTRMSLRVTLTYLGVKVTRDLAL